MNQAENKKVLFIAYLFPPVGGGGVQRSSKFVKYLPKFGWKPIVLTVKEPYDFYSDESLSKDLGSDIKVYRTISIEPMRWVRKILLQKTREKIKERDDSNQRFRKSLKPGFLIKLKTYLLVPDNEILWFPFALLKGLRIIKKERPSVIYSTASPYTDHLVALVLSKLSGLPWVADFRDPWVDRANFPRNRWRLFIDRKLEKKVLTQANQIITVTSLMADRFKELVPTLDITVITNGYDEEDFVEIKEQKPPENEFRITYAGIFNKQRNPCKFFLALKQLIEEREDFRNNIRLRVIGQLDNPGDFENLNYFNELNLNEYSDLIDYQPHHKVIAEMHQATVLLLIIGDYPRSESIMTGKIFEYLRARRPIFAVVPPEGVAANVIRDTGSGLIVSNKGTEEINIGLSKMFDLFLMNKLSEQFNARGIEQYNRKNLTGKLAGIINNLSEGKNV